MKTAKQELNDRIEELKPVALKMSAEERNELVNHTIEQYVERTGKRPPAAQLELLANILLVEEIKDRTPDKLSKKEYPFLSDRQVSTRSKRELSIEGETIDFLHQKETKRMDSAFKKRTKNMED